MKKLQRSIWLAAVAGVVGLPASLSAQLVQSFDDIQFWVGTGSQEAALVIQWNDGDAPVSMAWGFRWDGIATGADMLKAVVGVTTLDGYPGDPLPLAGADSRLELGLVYYSGFGDAVRSMVFSDGSVTRTQDDWDSGFWGYSIFGGSFEYYDFVSNDNLTYSVAGSSSYSEVDWLSSPIGFSTRELVDGSWDAWSFSTDVVNYTIPAIENPVGAVPEPGISSLLGLAIGIILWRKFYARKERPRVFVA